MPHSLRPYNTFGIEADCKELICYHSIDECLTAARHLQSSGLPWLPIGEGSNILFDLEKWQEAIAREHETMIRARQIAAELGLDMKIGDVEFQGDGTKAIFYYIADARVDFRQL